MVRDGKGGMYDTHVEAYMDLKHIPRKGDHCVLMPKFECEVSNVTYDLTSTELVTQLAMPEAVVTFVIDDLAVLVKLNRYDDVNWVLHHGADELDLMRDLKAA